MATYWYRSHVTFPYQKDPDVLQVVSLSFFVISSILLKVPSPSLCGQQLRNFVVEKPGALGR